MLSRLLVFPTPRQAVVELLFAAVIWGGSFAATRWGLLGLGPFWLTAVRFLLAFAVAYPLIRSSRTLREGNSREQFLLAAIPGFLIGGSLVLQSWGLQYTSVTKSGFITTLYVVIVPLLEWIVLKKRVGVSHVFWVAVALAGAALICEVNGATWEKGDLLTLGCALGSAVHILWLEIITTRIASPLLFNIFQSFWAGLLPLLVAWRVDVIRAFPPPPKAIVGICILAFASTLIAFMVQIRSQRVLRPSVVSMLFLLESPIAAFFGFVFFNERLAPAQWAGALLILGAAVGSIRAHSSKA